MYVEHKYQLLQRALAREITVYMLAVTGGTCLAYYGILSCFLGIGTNINVIELQMMASYPASQNYIGVENFAGLTNIVANNIQELICNGTVRYIPYSP